MVFEDVVEKLFVTLTKLAGMLGAQTGDGCQTDNFWADNSWLHEGIWYTIWVDFQQMSHIDLKYSLYLSVEGWPINLFYFIF